MWHHLRRVSQLVAAVVLLSPLAGLSAYLGTYSASYLLGLFHLADPFTALQTGVLPLALAALPVVLLNLLLGRVFCGWFCPLGFLLEGVDWVRRRFKLLDRFVPAWARYPLVGSILALSLLAGQPLFEWIGPQANLYRLVLFGFAWEAIIIPAVALADLLVARRLWCRTLCPAGVTYGLLARSGPLRVALNPDSCDRCGACMNACPQGRPVLQNAVARRGELVADPSACIACGECIDVCPSRSLSFQFQVKADPGRRKALITLGAATLAAVLGGVARPASAKPRGALRPPGALPEAEFLARCVRCGTCAQSCPRRAIRLENGLPYVEPRSEACDMCRICPDVCPTGALTLGPEEPIRMGTAEIDKTQCLAYMGGLCRACFVACPLQGTAIRLDQVTGVWKPIVNSNVCTGCGLCEKTCPQEPSAITVRY